MSNVKLALPGSAAYTITLGALATSSTLVAGRQSTAVDNTSNLYLDYLISGKVETGTSPTAGIIEVWAFASVNDTPTYPDVLGGSDAAVTFTSRDILSSSMRLVASMPTSATSNVNYWFAATSLASLFGGFCPKLHGIVVLHNTANPLNATNGNHVINYTPVYATVA